MWCESTITLVWIDGQPKNWKTFVANRVAEIKELTSDCIWQYVCSEQNPADIISRGLSPQRLQNSDMWWSGPRHLWPVPRYIQLAEIPEMKKESPLTFICTEDSDIIKMCSRVSNFTKLINAFTYLLRFINNINPRKTKLFGNLSVDEVNRAETQLIRFVQTSNFADEINKLKKGKEDSGDSKLRSLNPFIDPQDLVRVGGRIKFSNESQDRKFPIALPSKHPFNKLLIEHYHKENFHAATQATLFTIRTKFWPLNAKNTVKNVDRELHYVF